MIDIETKLYKISGITLLTLVVLLGGASCIKEFDLTKFGIVAGSLIIIVILTIDLIKNREEKTTKDKISYFLIWRNKINAMSTAQLASRIFVSGMVLIFIAVFILVIKDKPNQSEEVSKENVYNSDLVTTHCTIENNIKVSLIGSDGQEFFIDKGITKDKLAYQEDIYIDVKNNSQDCKFIGSLHIDGAGLTGQYGEIEIMPGAAQQFKYTVKNGSIGYQIDGQMVQVLDNDNLSKYKILGSKIKGAVVNEDKYIRVGIEIPEDFDIDNPMEVLNDFINTYTKASSVEEIIIYIYEKGYVMEDTTDMYKNAIYALTAYNDEGSFTYDVEDIKNNKILSKGEIE